MKKEIYYLQSSSITRAKTLIELGHNVTYYRDMEAGSRVWVVEWSANK